MKKEKGTVSIEDIEIRDMKKQIRIHKFHAWIKIAIVVGILALIATGVFFWMKYRIYNSVQIIETYEDVSVDKGNYIAYAGGILKYSKDGAALFDKQGQELWNHPCQMSHPIVEICEDAAVVGDEGGTDILVFQKDGLKGEIHTTRPIEKLTVSSQGIVAAVLKNEATPKVMCYDAKGNLLVEHNASMTNTGYPIDIALSQDGNTLLVSYLYTKGSKVATKVVYYHFEGTDKKNDEHQATTMEYENTIIPMTAFLNQNTSVLIGDNLLVFCEGSVSPKEKQRIVLKKEIRSVAYNDKYVALVLKNVQKSGYELCVYHANGKKVMSTDFEGEYNNIELLGNEIGLFDGNQCAIFNTAGVCKYAGKMEVNIKAMFPVIGINKYVVISTNGFQKIQLVK